MEFEKLDLTVMDKDLSEKEREEWNSIYASFRSKSLMTGKVSGADLFTAGDNQTNCLVVIPYRVKILIPEEEIWFDDSTKRPAHVLRSMPRSEVDFIITYIDREGDWCLASRRQAMLIKQRALIRRGIREGDKVQARILAVGKTHLLAEYGGYDMTLSQRDLSYAMIADLRELYHPGDSRTAVIKGYDEQKNRLTISVKEAEPHPFDGADQRHPVGCRRASAITGKYAGGVFCKLEQNLDCLCTYSAQQYDNNFDIGDEVIVVVTKYNYPKKQIYGKIVAKY